MTCRYTIPAIPASLNRYAGRRNSWDYRRDKADWMMLVKGCCRAAPPAPFERAVVTITYYFPDKRRRDCDNYCGKMILDGLVCGGVIRDDCFGCIELVLRADTDRDNPRTEILVEGVE